MATPLSTLYERRDKPGDAFPKPVKDGGRYKYDAQEVYDYMDRLIAERDKQWAEIRAVIRLAAHRESNRKRRA